MGTTLSVCKQCNSLNRIDLDKAKKQQAICGQCGSSIELKGAVTEVNEKNFWRIVNKSEKPVIIDFYAGWCGPCHVYAPAFQEASLRTDKAVFLKVNTESNQALSQELGIRGIPATLVFNKGKEIKRQAGALPVEAIVNLV